MKTIRNITLLLAASVLLAVSASAQQTYSNDFTSEGFPHTDGNPGWTLDTANEVMNLTIGGGTRNRTGGQFLTGWDATDFTVSTEFTVNDVGADAWGGLLAFGDGSTSSAGYLGNWKVAGTAGDQNELGELAILGLGTGSGFTASDRVYTGVSGAVGNSYRLEMTGAYTDSTLDLMFSVYDITTTPTFVGSITATDTAPLTDQYFGVRSRTNGGASSINFDYDNFAVVPEPASAGLVAGLTVLGGLVFFQWRKRR